ncbi:uncharacterized protein M6B38_203340 [Iris pallida]|uniref:Uncharacterized protein n=1 Tax=Iris pallida TaxID=29817 RepID=A0AAX6E885_IRIPA|nr:uncharacterized protein M6B38_206095 [Iris pallida]KAJ6800296.1 uncharacterized protein M6B38_203340 [Iris pallida]
MTSSRDRLLPADPERAPETLLRLFTVPLPESAPPRPFHAATVQRAELRPRLHPDASPRPSPTVIPEARRTSPSRSGAGGPVLRRAPPSLRPWSTPNRLSTGGATLQPRAPDRTAHPDRRRPRLVGFRPASSHHLSPGLAAITLSIGKTRVYLQTET